MFNLIYSVVKRGSGISDYVKGCGHSIQWVGKTSFVFYVTPFFSYILYLRCSPHFYPRYLLSTCHSQSKNIFLEPTVIDEGSHCVEIGSPSSLRPFVQWSSRVKCEPGRGMYLGFVISSTQILVDNHCLIFLPTRSPTPSDNTKSLHTTIFWQRQFSSVNSQSNISHGLGRTCGLGS